MIEVRYLIKDDRIFVSLRLWEFAVDIGYDVSTYVIRTNLYTIFKLRVQRKKNSQGKIYSFFVSFLLSWMPDCLLDQV